MANELDYLHEWRHRVGMKAISIKVKRIQLTKKNPRLQQRSHQSEMAVQKRERDALGAIPAKHPYCCKPCLCKPNKSYNAKSKLYSLEVLESILWESALPKHHFKQNRANRTWPQVVPAPAGMVNGSDPREMCTRGVTALTHREDGL